MRVRTDGRTTAVVRADAAAAAAEGCGTAAAAGVTEGRDEREIYGSTNDRRVMTRSHARHNHGRLDLGGCGRAWNGGQANGQAIPVRSRRTVGRTGGGDTLLGHVVTCIKYP